MIWFVPVAAVLACALIVVGAIVLAVEGRGLHAKGKSLKPPAKEYGERFPRAFERLQRDLEAAQLLVERARGALMRIDAAFRELAESPVARLFRSRGN
jgi:hypothetical protein